MHIVKQEIYVIPGEGDFVGLGSVAVCAWRAMIVVMPFKAGFKSYINFCAGLKVLQTKLDCTMINCWVFSTTVYSESVRYIYKTVGQRVAEINVTKIDLAVVSH